MKRQSAATWFQPASAESFTSVSACSGPSPLSRAPLKASIADLELGRLAQARHVAREPIRRPFDHARKRHGRIAELGAHARGVGQPALGALLAHEHRLLAEQLAA